MGKDTYIKFAKDNVVIGVSNLLSVVGNIFILLPVLTKKLGAHDYGIWKQVNVTVGLAIAFVGLGLPYTMSRFLAAKTDKQEIQEEFYSVLFVVFLVTLATSVFIIVCSNFIAKLFFEGATKIVIITGLIILLQSLDWVYLSFFRTFRQMGKYSLFTITRVFSEIMLIVYLVLTGHGLFSMVLSILLIRTVLFVTLFYVVKLEIGIKRPHFSRIKEYLSFGFPTIPGNISSWVVASSDRYIIGYFLGASWVGIYSVGYGLGNLPTMLIGIIGFVLPSTLSKLYDEGRINEVKTHLNYSLKCFLLFAIPFVFGTAMLCRQVMGIFSTQKIASQGYFIAPLVALSALFNGFYVVMSQLLVLQKKTKIIAASWIFASFVNFLLNILFIPNFGILGAVIATLIAYSLAMSIVTYYAFKELKFDIQWHFVVKSLVASVIMTLFIWMMDTKSNLMVIFTIIIGVIVYCVVLYMLGVFTKKEIQFLKKFLLHP